jgi:hypothetical protein
VPWFLLTILLSGCCGAGPARDTALPSSVVRAHAAALRREYKFAIVEVPPFVVVGGGPATEVRAYAREVVAWSYAALQRELFDHHPSRPIELWALRTPGSYAAWADEAIGSSPGSPYGEYVPCARAIIVDRSMGDGTLVHEMVHVLVEVDFPSAPTWLNEGLASLYERPGRRAGRIVGLDNWRGAALRRHLRHHRPDLRALMGTSRASFYGDHRARHYATARYLMLFLQQRGELRAFYHAMRDRGLDGPAAIEQAARLPLARFQRAWRSFVLRGRDPQTKRAAEAMPPRLTFYRG